MLKLCSTWESISSELLSSGRQTADSFLRSPPPEMSPRRGSNSLLREQRECLTCLLPGPRRILAQLYKTAPAAETLGALGAVLWMKVFFSFFWVALI